MQTQGWMPAHRGNFGSLSYRYTHAATLIYGGGGALTGKEQTPAEPAAAQINISPDP